MPDDRRHRTRKEPPPLPPRPRQRAKPAGTPFRITPAILAASVAALLALSVVIAAAVYLVANPYAVREAAYQEEVRFGDLGVTVRGVRVREFWSGPNGEMAHVHRPQLVVEIEFRCHNPNREVEAGHQVGLAALADDVGNTYRGFQAVDESGSREKIHGQISPGMVRPVRSDRVQHDVLVFHRPVPGANELTLTLDAGQYGGSGRLRVKIPASAWK